MHLWKFYFQAHFYGATNMIIFAYYTTRITREIIFFFQRLLPGLSLSIATQWDILYRRRQGEGEKGEEANTKSLTTRDPPSTQNRPPDNILPDRPFFRDQK